MSQNIIILAALLLLAAVVLIQLAKRHTRRYITYLSHEGISKGTYGKIIRYPGWHSLCDYALRHGARLPDLAGYLDPYAQEGYTFSLQQQNVHWKISFIKHTDGRFIILIEPLPPETP